MEELTRLTKALLAVNAQLLLPQEERGKPELLLNRAGLKHSEIADILGKTPAAVAKAVSRAK